MARKIIVNQTSSFVLSDVQTEALALGLGFIPTSPLLSFRENNYLQKAVAEWTRRIDLAFYFKSKESERRQPTSSSTSARPTLLKGYLGSKVSSTWSPPPGTWRSDSDIDSQLVNLSSRRPAEKAPTTSTTPIEILDAIQSLAANTGIHVLRADKGGAVVIVDAVDYDTEATRQLEDGQFYRELDRMKFDSTLQAVCRQRDALAETLFRMKNISANERDAIIAQPPAGSPIYFLPKIHKQIRPHSGAAFPGRPIVATHSCSMHLIDKLLAEITSPLLKLVPGSLHDSIDLIRRLPARVSQQQQQHQSSALADSPAATAASRVTMFTADVVAMYPSIPWERGVQATTQFYANHRHVLVERSEKERLFPPPSVALFQRTLRFVLRNSLIVFKSKRYFHQIKGAAMGMCISVFVSDCFMYYVTRSIIERPPPFVLAFHRLADDLFFLLAPHTAQQLADLMRSISSAADRDFPEYTANASPTRSVHMLDLLVTIDDDDCITVQPYAKPTATGLYLHPKSGHSKHVTASIPLAQFLRIRRLSSTKEIYLRHAKIMIRNFRLMEYPISLLLRQHERVLQMDRQNLLLRPDEKLISTINAPPSSSSTSFLTNTTRAAANCNAFINFILPFSPLLDWKAIQRAITEIHHTVAERFDCQQAISLKQSRLVASNRPNIGSRFTKNFKIL